MGGAGEREREDCKEDVPAADGAEGACYRGGFHGVDVFFGDIGLTGAAEISAGFRPHGWTRLVAMAWHGCFRLTSILRLLLLGSS